jgi:hypothetical protein
MGMVEGGDLAGWLLPVSSRPNLLFRLGLLGPLSSSSMVGWPVDLDGKSEGNWGGRMWREWQKEEQNECG